MEWNNLEVKDNEDNNNVIIKLNAESILKIFSRISNDDIDFMGFSSVFARPEWMVCQVFAVPPPAADKPAPAGNSVAARCAGPRAPPEPAGQQRAGRSVRSRAAGPAPAPGPAPGGGPAHRVRRLGRAVGPHQSVASSPRSRLPGRYLQSASRARPG